MKQTLRDFLCPQPKSKIKAGDGQLKGAYNFYTSSQIQSKFYHSATYTQPALIFGTGGMASVHYCNEPFSTSTDCLVMYGRLGAPLELIYYYLRSNMHLLQDGFKGAGLQHISKDYILNININMPAPSLQEQITHQMRLIDAMINGKKQQILSFDEAVKSRFIELFGDPVLNQHGWRKVALEVNATLLNGRAYKQDELLDSGKYPVLRVGNFFSNRGWYYSDLELDDDKYCDNGDLLYAWSASFGPQIWNGGKVIYHYHIWKVLVGEAYNKQFLCKLLEYATESLMGDTHGIAMMHLTKSGMEKTEFIVPPIERQEQFAAFVEQTDKSKYYSSLSFRYCQAAANTYRQEWMTCRTSDF